MTSRSSSSKADAVAKVTKPKVRACAECRRLKLRCDRIFPCQACVRRGCGALCPDKCFTDEATPSSLKANSLRSREEIKSLKERLAQVEAILSDLSPNHPILASSPLKDSDDPAFSNSINPAHSRAQPSSPHDASSPSSTTSSSKHGSAYAGRSTSDASEVQVNLDEAIDIFGTLSIGEDGMPVFHGATSQTENFIKMGRPHHEVPEAQVAPMQVEQPSLPSNIQWLSVLFPFPPSNLNVSVDINELAAFLPSPSDALAVCDSYWYHLSIGAAPISHRQFMKHIYHYFFPAPHTDLSKRRLEKSDAHKLGLLFTIMSLGSLTDLRLPMLSVEAEKWYQLGRAALCLDPICDNTTIAGLQAMVAMAWYIRHAPARATPGYKWAFSGLIAKLANSLGIMRDSRRWLTDPDEIEQREVLCWELMSNEIWQCFTAGRPCNLDLTLVDCPKPEMSASTHADLDGFIRGYSNWRHKFFPLVNDVLRVVQRPGPVKYSEILALERELRFCRMPEELESCVISPMRDTLSNEDITKHLQGITALMWRESACCMLHRRFLVLAMQDGDPRDSPFWYSAFQAGFGACWIVKAHMTLYRRHPELLARVPAFWSTAFSAAVILGSIAARYGNTEYAKAVVAPFMAICELFIKTANSSIQPANAAIILHRLQQRVQQHLSSTSGAQEESKNSFDDLSLLGAQPPSSKSPVSLSPSNSSSHLSNSPLSPSSSQPNLLPPSNHHLSQYSTPSPLNLNVNAAPSLQSSLSSAGSPLPPQTPQQQQQQQQQYYQLHQNLQLLEQLWAAPELSVLPESVLGFGTGENGQPLYTPLDQTWVAAVSSASYNGQGSSAGTGVVNGGLPTSTAGQAGYGNLPVDAVSTMPVAEHYMTVDGVPDGAGGDLGQWDQYLDRLGMWDVGTGVSGAGVGMGVENNAGMR